MNAENGFDGGNHSGMTYGNVALWQILLQKSLATLLNDDSVALMRFAVEAIDDGAAQARSGAVFLFVPA